MTPAELTTLRALATQATPLLVVSDAYETNFTCEASRDEVDFDDVATLANAVPRLLSYIDELECKLSAGGEK